MRGAMTAAVLAAMLATAGCQTWSSGTDSSSPAPDKKAQGRSQVDSMSSDTLARLETLRPGARRSIESAAGYAAFSDYGMQIIVAGGGVGRGVAVNNQTGRRTYMKMVEAQAGIGIGARKIQVVWVFSTEKQLNDFINKGWTLGGQGSAAAAVDRQGAGLEGAVPVAPGVWLYQLTDTGLALELTVQGSKYYKDDEIN